MPKKKKKSKSRSDSKNRSDNEAAPPILSKSSRKKKSKKKSEKKYTKDEAYCHKQQRLEKPHALKIPRYFRALMSLIKKRNSGSFEKKINAT